MPVIYLKKLAKIIRIVGRSFKQYRAMLTVMVVLGFIGGLAESIGIGAAIPLFYVMTGQESGGDGTINRVVISILKFFHISLDPLHLLLLIVGLFIFKGFIQFLSRYANARIVADFEEKTRTVLFARTMRTTWSFLLEQRIGHLENTLLFDVERSATILNQLSTAILTLTSFLAYAVVAFSISTKITLVTIAIGVLVFYLMRPLSRRIRKHFAEALRLQKALNHHVGEHMLGIKTIKAAAAEASVIAISKEYFYKLKHAKTRSAFMRQLGLAFIEPLGFILIAILFVLSYKTPAFSIASFVVVMYLIQKMFSYIQSLQGYIYVINELIPSLKSVIKYRILSRLNKEVDEGTRSFSFEKNLTFTNVAFSYGGDRPILQNVSMTIAKGDMVGIVGASGAGKTTLVDLLLRLFNPQSGTISVDGIPLSELKLEAWRTHVAYVAQEMFLINTTIEENIRFYDPAITKEAVERAAKVANIYDTIQDMPEQFQTIVGDRGLKLSGGQRQRIILARAIARNPSLLILDEATSAIDYQSESLIHEALVKLRGTITVIIITHRLEALKEVDATYKIEGGVAHRV